jgi:hypothetical protein
VLVVELAKWLKGKKAIEIAAGDGTLARFLGEEGVSVAASDDRSWNAFVEYPAEVELLSARDALIKHEPEVVLCSWPPSGNSFEKKVFERASVQLYIVIGGPDSGNAETYASQTAFTEVTDARLSRLVLPREQGNTVKIFQRKPPIR